MTFIYFICNFYRTQVVMFTFTFLVFIIGCGQKCLQISKFTVGCYRYIHWLCETSLMILLLFTAFTTLSTLNVVMDSSRWIVPLS